MKILTNSKNEEFFIAATSENTDEIIDRLHINVFPVGAASDYTYFESHIGYDFLSIAIRQFDNLQNEPKFINIYHNGKTAALICDDAVLLKKCINSVEALPKDNKTSCMAIIAVFAAELQHDHKLLEAIEDRIEGMEELATKSQPKGFVEDVIDLRKDLLILKRHYEAFYDALTDMSENKGGLFSEHDLKIIELYVNRSDRLSSTVMNLRDYLTQVRDLYQNQIDINLNMTMQFFTVITTIFLPLTLIAGWFGMNLKMPEYSWRFAYPVVIVVSIIIVLVLIRYFKKKKWF